MKNIFQVLLMVCAFFTVCATISSDPPDKSDSPGIAYQVDADFDLSVNGAYAITSIDIETSPGSRWLETVTIFTDEDHADPNLLTDWEDVGHPSLLTVKSGFSKQTTLRYRSDIIGQNNYLIRAS